MEIFSQMNVLEIRWVVRLCVALSVLSGTSGIWSSVLHAQEIKYEERIGSNSGFDMCESFRFARITKLVEEGKISQKQGYQLWKRIQSDKEAVRRILNEAVADKELTQSQANRLLPLFDMEMSYVENRHGRFGQPKELDNGQFKAGEVTAANRAAIYQRLIAANARGDMYDYDVASVMNQLYAGFDPEKASIEAVAVYRGALNPRIAQSGSEERVLQNARMQRERNGRSGYGSAEIKIIDPAEWTKSLEKTIYSGPQAGEGALPFTVINIRGESAGEEIDPTKLANGKNHLMFFVKNSRTFGRFLGHLRNQLQAIEENSKQPWAMSVVVCTDDANEAEKSFAVLDQRYPKNLVVGLSTDGSAGPPAYGLDKNLTATVIVVKEGKVTHNFVHAGDAFYAQPHFLGAVASVMGVDHDTLRKYIAQTPGDAAAAVAARNRMLGDRESTAGAAGEFRRKLLPLVQNGRLNRAEAAELLDALGNDGELQKKVGELLSAKKISDEEAKTLLNGDPKRRSTLDESKSKP